MNSVLEASGLAPRAAAARAAIGQAERDLGVRFPEDYVEFLLSSDGVEGALDSGAYIMLFAVGELAAINEAAAVSEFAPGFTIIGSDGGGTTYGFVLARAGAQYSRTSDMDLSIDALEVLGGTLHEMVRRLAN